MNRSTPVNFVATGDFPGDGSGVPNRTSALTEPAATDKLSAPQSRPHLNSGASERAA